jgi:Cytochrome c554 and c-prime
MRARPVFALAFSLLSLLSLQALEGVAGANIGSLKGTKPGDLAFPDFTDADTCASCHGGGISGDTSFLPSDTWAGTMMANAARDPVFFAALAVANQDKPGLGTYCLRCHSPTAFVSGHATPPDGSAFDDIDKQGIGCDTCHRATQSAGADAPYILSDAQLVFTEDTGKHGPYEDTMSPAHGSVVEDSMADAHFCGQCHQVTNPDVFLRDASGKDTGLEFPLDTTYEEWKSSDFGQPNQKTCQDCHMPKKIGMKPVTKLFDSPLHPDPREHGFVGGNHWGIQAVMAANPDRAQSFAKPFSQALQSTLDNLAAGVKLTLTDAPKGFTAGGAFQVKVKVENLTGHKFPTGYAETRRAWIGVTVVGADMKEQTLAGGYDLTTGKIQDTPAVHVYHAEHGAWDGSKGVVEPHIALHDMIITDTRIPPAGFKASTTTKPLGDVDFSDGNGGYKSSDEVTLDLTWPGDVSGQITLSARLYYQSMTPEHVEFLDGANTTNAKGKELAAVFEATGRGAPLVIAKAEALLGVPATTTTTTGVGGAGGGGVGGNGSGTTGAVGGAGGSGGESSSGGDKGGCGCSEAGAPVSAAGALVGMMALAMAGAGRRKKGWSERTGVRRP